MILYGISFNNSPFKSKMIDNECVDENNKKIEFTQPSCRIGEIYDRAIM